jgi:DNA-binding transcriptional LysR family regulator
MGTSISTLHRQLAQLETELDTRLLERRGRGQVLTAAGEALVERASRIEEEVIAIERDVAGRDGALRGAVVLTTTDTLADALLPRVLPTLRARFPEVQMDVLVDNRHYQLGRGEADIALRPGSKPEEPDVVARHVADVAYAWYASDAYVERMGLPRRRADLRRHDAIVVDETLAHVVYGRLAAEFTDPTRRVLRSPSLLVQARAVCAGLGVAALPCFLMAHHEGVRRLFAPEPEAPLWLLYPADLRRTARVRAVVDVLHEAFVAERPVLEGRASL